MTSARLAAALKGLHDRALAPEATSAAAGAESDPATVSSLTLPAATAGNAPAAKASTPAAQAVVATADGADPNAASLQAEQTSDDDAPPESGTKDASRTAKQDASTPNGTQAQNAPSQSQPVAAAVLLNTGSDAPATAAQAPSDGATTPVGNSQTDWSQISGDLHQTPIKQSQQGGAANQPNVADSAAIAAKIDAKPADSAPQPHPQPGPQPQAQTPAPAQSQPQSQQQAQSPDAQTPSQAAGSGAGLAAAAVTGILQFAADRPTLMTNATAGADISAPGGHSATLADSITPNGTALSNFGLIATNGATATGAPAAVGGSAVPISGLAVTIAAHAQAGSNRFDIRLDPPELGRIDVRLAVDSNGQVTSHVTVDRPDTLQLLQSQQPQLQHALEQAGLTTAENGLQFTLRDQSFAGQNGGGFGPQPGPAQLVIPDAELPKVATTDVYSRLRLGGGLDIRV